MCQRRVNASTHASLRVLKRVQAGGGRHFQDRDAPRGHKGDDRQERVCADFSAPLILHPHTHEGGAACEARSSLHAHTLTSTLPAPGNNHLSDTLAASPTLTHLHMFCHSHISLLPLSFLQKFMGSPNFP